MRKKTLILYIGISFLFISCVIFRHRIKKSHIDMIKISMRESYFGYKKDALIADKLEIKRIVKLLKRNKSSFILKVPIKYQIYIYYTNGKNDTIGLYKDIIKTDYGYYRTRTNVEDSISIYFKDSLTLKK